MLNVNVGKQRLCHRKDAGFRRQRLRHGAAARNLCEIGEFHFKRQHVALKLAFAQPFHQLKHQLIQMHRQQRTASEVFLKRALATYRLALAVDHHRTIIDAARKVVVHGPHLPERAYQPALGV